VLGEEGLDIIGLELGIRLDIVVLDEPVSHISLFPRLVDIIWQLIPVVLKEFLQSVSLVPRSLSFRDYVVFDEVSASFGVGPGVPETVVGRVVVRLHGANQVVALGFGGRLDQSFLLEPVADGVVVPGLVGTVSKGVVIVADELLEFDSGLLGSRLRLYESSRDSPFPKLRIGPRVVGGVSCRVVVSLHEIYEIVSCLCRLGLDDSVIDEPLADVGV